MKKILSALCLLLWVGGLCAQNDALLTKIKAANTTPNRFTCSFTQSKHMKAMTKTFDSNGNLYYEAGKMNMTYEQPDGDYLIINDKQFVMRSRGKLMNHNVKAGSPMLTLRNTLIYCLQGDINAIAETNKANAVQSKEGAYTIYTLTPLSKPTRGYTQIVLKFDANLLLHEMVLTETNGNYTVYTLGKQDRNKTINPQLFTPTVQ